MAQQDSNTVQNAPKYSLQHKAKARNSCTWEAGGAICFVHTFLEQGSLV